MALYEEFLHRDEMKSAAGSGGRPYQGRIAAAVRAACVGYLLACWLAGAYGGIVYWSIEGSLLSVIASAMISGVGITFTWTLFTGLASR